MPELYKDTQLPCSVDHDYDVLLKAFTISVKLKNPIHSINLKPVLSNI